MKKIKSLFFLLLIVVVANAQQAKINFIVSFPEAKNNYVDVQMNIDDVAGEYVDVKLPVWTPGSYMVREFSKNVEQFSAQGIDGQKLKFEKITKNTWRINTSQNKSVKINYKVYAFELSVRTSFVDATHAFLATTGIFMCVDKRLNEPATVEIKLSNGWDKISTGMKSISKNTYYAPDFDWLYDSPIEVGNQEVFTFTASGVEHEVAMYGNPKYDKEKLKKDMAKVVDELTAIFGENPNKNYTFIVHNTLSGGGGLEHLNSTVLGVNRNSYQTESGYKGFLNLVAHEYFHLWNVKRLRPIALGPFNYDEENYTTNLWIAEGFTSYYDNLTMRYAGFYSQEEYLNTVASDFGVLENTPGNKIQPLSESSLDAWIKFYRPNENSKNSTISYYTKGGAIATLMDLLIIHSTKGEKCLGDVMKAMYDTYYKKENRGYTDAEFKQMAEKISGVNLDDFYNKYIYGTESIPCQEYLAYAGLTMSDLNATKNDASLNVSGKMMDGKYMISGVMRNGAAWNAGLNVNDLIETVDGYSADTLTKYLSSKKPGDEVLIKYTRDGNQYKVVVKLQRVPYVSYAIAPDPKATEIQIKVLKKWLKL